MWFLVGFFGAAILTEVLSALLAVVMGRGNKLLVGLKEHLVFFTCLGVWLVIFLHHDISPARLGNTVPSGVACSMLIETWRHLPSWASLSKSNSPNDNSRLQL